MRLERVEILTDGTPVLHVAGGDLADNTPVFDIKPYLPYADAVPDAASGFAKTGGTLRVVCDETMLKAVPEEKRGAKKNRVIAAIAAYTLVAITVGLFAATAVLFGLEKKDAALITLYAALALAAIQIFGVVFFAAKRK